MQVIENPTKPWSVRILTAATAVAGLEAALPTLQGMLPPHWYAVVFGVTLVARLIKQSAPA